MDLNEYKKALMLCAEPAELLTAPELRERVELLRRALHFKSWREQVAMQRLQSLEEGQTVNLDLFRKDLDALWPHADDPAEVSTNPDGTLKITRKGGNVFDRFMLHAILVTGLMLAVTLYFG